MNWSACFPRYETLFHSHQEICSKLFEKRLGEKERNVVALTLTGWVYYFRWTRTVVFDLSIITDNVLNYSLPDGPPLQCANECGKKMRKRTATHIISLEVKVREIERYFVLRWSDNFPDACFITRIYFWKRWAHYCTIWWFDSTTTRICETNV